MQPDEATAVFDGPTERGREIAARVERFVREVVIPYEHDPRRDSHGPTDEMVHEMRGRAREAATGVTQLRNEVPCPSL